MIGSNVVLSPERLREEVAYFMEQGAFAFDVESMGDDRSVPIVNTLCWMGLATKGRTIVVPFGHPNGDVLVSKATRKLDKETRKFVQIPAVYDSPPEQLRPSEVFEILRPLFFSDRVKVAHNATFDLISVAKYFGEVPPPEYSDTIVLQWLLDENLKSKKLKELVKKYYGMDYDTENTGRCIEIHPFSKVAHYQYMDAKYTWLLYQRLLRQIEGQGLTNVLRLEMDVLGVLLDMGVEGAPIDEETLDPLIQKMSDRLVEAEADVYKAAGQRFNINSPAQKIKVLYEPKSEGGQALKPHHFTASGAPSTDAAALERHPGNKVVKNLQAYADIKALLNFPITWAGVSDDPEKPCRIFDGRIHADFVQYGTVTGRFSCRQPNLQNIPRPDTDLGKQIRSLFVPPDADHSLIVADYGQIELVVLAHYAKGSLWEGFQRGEDPHAMTAAGVLGKPVGEVTKDERQRFGKSINFAVVYGAGPTKVANMADISEADAKKFLGLHQRAFPEIYRFKSHVIKTARARKPPHIRTLLGRKRRLPTLLSSEQNLRSGAERQVVNSLIQGGAADLIKFAMVRANNRLPEDMHLILSVHDELVTIVPTSKAEEGSRIIQEAMLGAEIQALVTAPLSADVKVVQRWSDAK